MKIIYTDVLVIGGGLAGQRAAIGARRRGHDVIVLSLVPAKRSHSAAAQGGMQASLANAIKGEGDNEDVHFADTVRGSDWGADQEVVRMFVNTAPKAVRELAAWGVPWNRVRARRPRGRRSTARRSRITRARRGPRPDHGARLRRHQEVAHLLRLRRHRPRDALHHEQPGHRRIGIPVHERMEAMALIHDGGRCYGAIVRDLITGELHRLCRQGHRDRHRRLRPHLPRLHQRGHQRGHGRGDRARDRRRQRSATWRRCSSTRPASSRPASWSPRAAAATAACCSTSTAHRFMPDYEPEKKELASRDVVSRRMEEHIAQGQGRAHRASATTCGWTSRCSGEAHIEKNLREVKEICQYFLGIDPARELIPVRPAQHYSMGGVRTDHRGESPTLRGLFAVRRGRLLGHARLQPPGRQLGGRDRGGRHDRRRVRGGLLRRPANGIDISTALIDEFWRREAAALDALVNAAGRGTRVRAEQPDAGDHDRQGRHLPQRRRPAAGGRRTAGAAGSAAATSALRRQGARRQPGTGRGLPRCRRMLKLALCVAYGALQRTESRGAHFRAGLSRSATTATGCKRTLATWPDAGRRPADAWTTSHSTS